MATKKTECSRRGRKKRNAGRLTGTDRLLQILRTSRDSADNDRVERGPHKRTSHNSMSMRGSKDVCKSD